MSDTDIRVRAIIAEETGLPLGSVVPGSRLAEDIGLGEGDLAYVVGEIESAFGVELDSPELERVRTVGALIRLVDGTLAGFARR